MRNTTTPSLEQLLTFWTGQGYNAYDRRLLAFHNARRQYAAHARITATLRSARVPTAVTERRVWA